MPDFFKRSESMGVDQTPGEAAPAYDDVVHLHGPINGFANSSSSGVSNHIFHNHACAEKRCIHVMYCTVVDRNTIHGHGSDANHEGTPSAPLPRNHI